MFDRIFNMDSPLVRFIFRVRDLFILNLLTLLCMIPVFTAGPALKALAFTSLKIVRDEDGNIVKTYFKNFKMNFGQTVLFGIVCIIMIAVGFGDIFAMYYYHAVFPVYLMIPAVLAVFVVFGILVWAIPMQGRFLNPIGATFKNAFWAMLVKLPKTLLMLIAFTIVPSLYFFVSGNFFPLILMFGLSFPAYINAILYEPFFTEVEEAIMDREDMEAKNAESQTGDNTDTESVEAGVTEKDQKEAGSDTRKTENTEDLK
ncbi:MAG: YesL family protein [Lachnospiraceae bacterium]|nr:YesL family protein [Lachnospiraceae bacterium]